MSRFVFTASPQVFPLHTPLRVGGITTNARDVLWLSAGGADDPELPTASGEAAPLPGLHAESLDDVEAAFDEQAQEALFADSFEACAAALTHVPPSLRFALESIRLGWQARVLEIPVASVLSDTPREYVNICALIEATADAVVPSGAQAIKIKVGRHDPSVEREALARILDALPDEVSVCLDANRAWTLADAIERLKGLDPARITYVEEPLRDPRDLPALYQETGLHVALDESLHEDGCEDLCEAEAIAGYVVKPSRFGIAQTLAWDQRAQALGKRTVISSCFESPLGLSMLAHIAAALPSHTGAAGLGTLAWFTPQPAWDGFDATTHQFRIGATT